MPTRPVVRFFLACASSTPGTAVDQHRLSDLTNIVYPASGDTFPLIQEELCFYAILTDGRGPHDISVRQLYGVAPVSQVLWESRSVRVDLGSDPLALRGLPIRFRNILFPQPGQYEFALVCDGEELEPFLWLEARLRDAFS